MDRYEKPVFVRVKKENLGPVNISGRKWEIFAEKGGRVERVLGSSEKVNL